MDKTVQVRDLVIGEGRPKICIPVMGSTTEIKRSCRSCNEKTSGSD